MDGVCVAVTGCADLTSSGQSGAPHWMERSGDSALFGCNTTADTWRLRCDGNRWVGGARKNCTAMPAPGRRRRVQIIALDN